MSARQIIAPTTLPVTLPEARAQMRVTIQEDDASITGYLQASLAYAEKYCTVAFEPQTWELNLDAFPVGAICLTPGPIVEIVSAVYIDPDGVTQTIDETLYRVDFTQDDGWMVPTGSWPTAMNTINAVTVTYISGAGTPPDVRQAILLAATHYYDNRGAAGAASAEIPLGVRALLWQHARMYV